MKVVINRCYGGFSISKAACLWLWDAGYYTKFPDEKTPALEYFEDEQMRGKEYDKFLNGEERLFDHIFSPDGEYVLDCRPKCRDSEHLIACVETLGAKANGFCADLKIVEIPDGVEYEIDDYDGMEKIDEIHRSWS